MLKVSNFMKRRYLVTVLGSGAILGVMTKGFKSVAQTTSEPSASGDAIDILLADHRNIEALMDQIAQTTDSDVTAREQLLQQLADLFTLHNSTEENIIYPAIRDIADLPIDTVKLYYEQDEAKIMVFELDQLPKNDPQWGNRFKKLRTAVLAHVAQEENIDFPRLRTAAGPKLAELTTKVLQLRSHWNIQT